MSEMNKDIYTEVGYNFSQAITVAYSTSFTSAVRLLPKDQARAIYAIYGYVRVADELVDTWRPSDMTARLQNFKNETKVAIKSGYSLNSVIHSFAIVVQKYKIPQDLIWSFLDSMQSDVVKRSYTQADYQRYIYGSAEVVGLMCLAVFVEGDMSKYKRLKKPAQALGSAFQKVNFLRDLKADQTKLHRQYFPNLKAKTLSEESKAAIISEIQDDFVAASPAIKKLPHSSKYAVWLAHVYYRALLRKIQRTPAKELMTRRVRINNLYKTWLFLIAYIRSLFHW